MASDRNYDFLHGAFSNPFLSISSKWMPKSMRQMLDLCEWMYLNNSTYKAAIERIARLFYTFPEYDTAENISSVEVIKDFVSNSIDFRRRIITCGRDYLGYGNAFIGLFLPFKRWIKCPTCKKTYPAEHIDLDFSSDGHFTGTCVCGARPNKFFYRDTPLKNLDKINIIRFSPKEMEIVTNKISNTSTYYWKMLPRDKQQIMQGKGTTLIKEMPIEILTAAFTDKKIQFANDEILHIKDESLAGIDMEWGTPFALSCFPLIFYIAILRKANEAISMDYIIPLRIIFPQSSTSNQEASYMNLGNFVGRIREILKHHRADPADYHVCPVPVGYQTMGGEKRSLMISDDIKLSTDELLSSMGFPAELFQTSPMALRLLENTFDLTAIYNKIFKWVFKRVTAYMSMDNVDVALTPLRLADDMERRNMIMNLSAAQKISDISLLEMYNMDYEKEQEKKLKQMQIIAKLETKAEKDKQKEQQMQDQAAGGPSQASTPTEIMQTAGEKAQQLIMMPESMRRSELDTLLKTNPLLHHAIRAEMESQRGKMGTQGAAMIQQQMMGQAGGVAM